MIAHSQEGYKMLIPMANAIVPVYYRNKIIETITTFMKVYALYYGGVIDNIENYANGYLVVALDRKIPIDNKYKINIVIILDNDKDYTIEVKVLPTDEHFVEFIQCFREEFDLMIFGNKTIKKIER